MSKSQIKRLSVQVPPLGEEIDRLRAKIEMQERALRDCFMKLRPPVSYGEWLKQWEKP